MLVPTTFGNKEVLYHITHIRSKGLHEGESEKTTIQHSEFEFKLMRFAVFWITDGKFNNRDETTSKKFAIMLFYFLSFGNPKLSSLIVDFSTKTNIQDCEHIFVQWSMGDHVNADGAELLRTII